MDRTALILTIIGAINWASVGIFRFDFISAALGSGTTLSRIAYTLVGLAGLWCVSLLFRNREKINEM